MPARALRGQLQAVRLALHVAARRRAGRGQGQRRRAGRAGSSRMVPPGTSLIASARPPSTSAGSGSPSPRLIAATSSGSLGVELGRPGKPGEEPLRGPERESGPRPLVIDALEVEPAPRRREVSRGQPCILRTGASSCLQPARRPLPAVPGRSRRAGRSSSSPGRRSGRWRRACGRARARDRRRRQARAAAAAAGRRCRRCRASC